MAQELKLTMSATFTKGSVSESFGSNTAINIDVSGSNVTKITHAVGTSPEALTLGDAGDGGFLFMKNIGAADLKIHVGPDDVVMSILKPGEVGCWRRDTAANKISASSGTTQALYLLVQA